MLERASSVFMFITEAPRLPGEDIDAGERKRTLCSILLFGSLALLGVSVVFVAFSDFVSVAINISFLLHAMASFLVLRLTGRGYSYGIYANAFLVHAVAFSTAWLNGGFLNSGCFYLWGFTSPLALGLLPRGSRGAAAISMVGFVIMLALLAYRDTFPTGAPLPPPELIGSLTIINVTILLTLVLVSSATLVRGLGDTSADLAALNRTLDLRVQQRTAELVDANDDLRREVRERERAEQALVESESKLRHAQKMESIGRLAGGIAHDFNNLLTVMLSYCELVLVSLEEEDETREDVEEIKAAAERASKLTRQLLAFGRQQIFEVKVLDLNDLIEEMIPMLERLIGEDIVLDVTMSPDAGKVLADRGQLEQVLMNLVVNARDAMPGGGTLGIATGALSLDASEPTEHPELRTGRYARLRVTDTGTGMDAKTRARIFDPFFTTKPTGKGTGLGLSTAYGIVKQSEGAISVDSAVGEGSTFDVILPETDQEAEGAVVTPKRSRGRAGNETVLLVEDESQVREVIRSVLERNGYSVLEADGAERALELCEVHGVEIDLLLTDLVMPQMNGRQLAREILRRRPQTKVLYMSGYASDVAVRMGIRDGDLDFLAKPILPGSLVAKVREVLVAERPRRSEPHQAARSSASGRFARTS